VLRILSVYEPQAYAIMRIIVGLLFVCHGLQKAAGAFGGVNGEPAPLFSLLSIAGYLELALGLMITMGIFTVAAAFLASGQMAAAYFIGHFPMGYWPIMNQGEVAVLYCFVFLYIAARGPGIWSVDMFGSATR
jgi:putative oxidoreductase